MSPLNHPEAHEQLSDLSLAPGALDRVGPPATDPLSAHVASCETCAGEIRAWRRTEDLLETALGSGEDRPGLSDLVTEDSIGVPAGLRDSVLAAIRDLPAAVAGDAGARSSADERRPVVLESRRWAPIAWRVLPLVAALAIVAVGAGLIVDQAGRLDAAHRETAALEAVAATVDRVLRDPTHRTVELHGADGTASGSMSWSRRDIAVLALALVPPPPDRVYRCWIDRGGVRSPVGEMQFAGGTAYWIGSLSEWATTSFAAGTFGVSLEPVSGSVGNPAVLAADLGG